MSIAKNKLKQVHIGSDVWKIGAVKKKHAVIYGPNRTEYDVYDKDIDFISKPDNEDYHESWQNRDISFVNRHGNNAIESKLKIYILTHILDDKKNWCFDLKNIPENGKLKIIYENGTVKNTEFNGSFHRAELKSKRYLIKQESVSHFYGGYSEVGAHTRLEFVEPVAYRYIK